MWDLRAATLTNGSGSLRFTEYAGDLTHPVTCEHCWRKANPGLDDLIHRDSMHALLKTLREPSYRRWRLGERAEDSLGQWMAPELWAACADDLVHVREQSRWVLGLDGSAPADVTALVAVPVEERPHIEVVAFWQPTKNEPVPVLDVEEAIRQACRDRQVVRIVADPFRWTRSLQVLLGEGFPMEEYPQAPARLTPATTKLYEAVVNKAVTHSGDKDLALHVAHAVVKTDARGTRITKEHKSSPRRIDLAMAAIMAFDRATELAGKTIQFW